MGIFLDTIEDRDERLGQFIDQAYGGQWTPSKEIEPFDQPLIECPLCGELILSKEGLDQHIVAKHANKHVYVRINNKIVRGLVYLKEPPETLQVVLLGINHARLTIEKKGSPAETLEFSDGISLIPYLKGFTSGEIHLRIEYEREFREFGIFFGGWPEFNHKPIDQDALKFLFLPLNNNEDPNFSEFSDRFLTPTKYYIQLQYARGFYDYALGFYMVHTGKEGNIHFESALNILAPFKTKSAITAQRVLALRMNCFKLLRACGSSSRFTVADLFFNQPEARFAKEITLSSPKWSPQEYGIYIDKFTDTFLDALSAYYNEDYQMLDALCHQLDKMLPELDRNNRDKLILLSARVAKKRNEEVLCKRFYQMLRYHPDFKDEAREMLE
jgi:hypothetical protein